MLIEFPLNNNTKLSKNPNKHSFTTQEYEGVTDKSSEIHPLYAHSNIKPSKTVLTVCRTYRRPWCIYSSKHTPDSLMLSWRPLQAAVVITPHTFTDDSTRYSDSRSSALRLILTCYCEHLKQFWDKVSDLLSACFIRRHCFLEHVKAHVPWGAKLPACKARRPLSKAG